MGARRERGPLQRLACAGTSAPGLSSSSSPSLGYQRVVSSSLPSSIGVHAQSQGSWDGWTKEPGLLSPRIP